MISVKEAQNLIRESVGRSPGKKLTLSEASGRFLAEPVLSPLDLPTFDNSAMDGYALRSEETQEINSQSSGSFVVSFTVGAGDQPRQELKTGEAARIFTGAMIPPGADTVVIQEEVLKNGSQVTLKAPLKPGKNIRRKGEELKKGDKIFEIGAPLNPAAMGLLASMGVEEVSVYAPPKVGILVTGSEIVEPPGPLAPGKIFDSNSFSLRAALEELKLTPSFRGHAPDEKEKLQETITHALGQCDFLLVTGGVSVGDYDFVKDVAAQIGIREIFWKVRQKPGKPIFFGKSETGKFLFGLPGNPASALVCYFEYVRPALLFAMGSTSPFLPKLRAPLTQDFQKKGDKTLFLRSFLHMDSVEPRVEILEQQGSHTMKSFARANGLTVIPGEASRVSAGELVEVHLLPSFGTGSSQ